MDRKQTLIINLVAGPCAGKSTSAAELFATLKKMNISCELVSEYIKEEIYKENKSISNNQVAIFGNEVYSLDNKIGKVDVIVHDGSLLNNIVYDPEHDAEFKKFIIYWFNKYENLNFYIKRGNIKFETYGRLHNQDEAKELDKIVDNVHKDAGVEYHIVRSKTSVKEMLPIVLEKLNAINKRERYVIAEAYHHTYYVINKEAPLILSNNKIGTPTLHIISYDTMINYWEYPDISFYKIPNKYKNLADIKEAYNEGMLEPEELEKYVSY